MTTEAARRLLEDLNAEQRQAVETVEGPLLVVAGPGSGKTRVITYRIAYLVRVLGVNPRRILAVTFTNKAAREMLTRLQGLLGDRAKELTVGTFHNFGARVLRSYGDAVGIPKDFVIYDEDDQQALMKRAMQDVQVDPKRYAPSAVHAAISAAKNQLVTVQDHATRQFSPFDKVVHRVYERYEALLRESHAVDFDDLLLLPVLLFQRNEEVLKRYQERYLHVLVDEWQDTNRAQYLLTSQIAELHKNLCVVGDPDQSIYSWRYADIRNILDFEHDFSNAKTVVLGRNYRSTQNILDAAHGVIVANKQRKDVRLWTDKGAGTPLVLTEAFNKQEEAVYLAGEIERLVNKERKHRYADMAVMYRTNAQSRAPEEAFVRHGIPYRIIGGLRFWERREVKDALAYLRVIHNPFDSVSLARIVNVPPRGIGAKTLDELTQWATRQNVPLYAALQMAVAPQDVGADGGPPSETVGAHGRAPSEDVPGPQITRQAQGSLRV
ncbi:MAG: DNA helicase UvrD, partial [SAR202 cluster bacterium]|nr:DNA helicase UvrD [SAR202 cluster bacterium]